MHRLALWYLDRNRKDSNPMNTRPIVVFLLFLAACFGAAAFGAQFAPGEWYAGLNKPPWNPPNWIFGPVWTALYLMMAISGWLVWQARGFGGAAGALGCFAVQLLLNAAWSWLFFGLHRPGLAFAEIVVLWAAILATILLFRKIRPLAGALLVPYLLWVSFAAVLNLRLWQLNG
jgi:tryptophan-rich sensory protein